MGKKGGVARERHGRPVFIGEEVWQPVSRRGEEEQQNNGDGARRWVVVVVAVRRACVATAGFGAGGLDWVGYGSCASPISGPLLLVTSGWGHVSAPRGSSPFRYPAVVAVARTRLVVFFRFSLAWAWHTLLLLNIMYK